LLSFGFRLLRFRLQTRMPRDITITEIPLIQRAADWIGSSCLITRHNRRTFNRIFGALRVVASCDTAALQMTRQTPLFFDSNHRVDQNYFRIRVGRYAKIVLLSV